ncbi:MAG: MFS transporter [Candidatus Moraniibacteriota bacterium]|nr:MAG: MFS transporter [Candidatus Moranbacteria bacterium]
MPETQPDTHDEIYNRNKVRLLSALSFLLGFLDAFLIYILSSYFVQISGAHLVGSFYLVAFVLVLWLLMHLQPLVHSLGSVRFLGVLLVGLIGTSFYLSLGEPSWIGAVVLLAYIVCSNLVWSVMDVLVEDFSTDQVSGRVRGLYLTVMNGGLLLAPILSTKTLAFAGYSGVFTVLGIGYMLVFLAALIGLRAHQTVPLPKIAFLATLRKVSQRRNLLLIYGVSWTLEFFYAIMIIYVPILLLSQGFDWEQIGFIFTVMLIPFVLIQYPLGVMADKRFGEKELLFVALVILGVSSVVVGFTRSTDIVFWAGLLFLTRLGAAAIEVLRDSYFYKQIGPTDTDIVAFFRSARPTADIVAAGVSLLFLALFSVHSLFYLVGAVALGACFAVLSLEDSQSEAERAKRTAV